MNEKTRPLLYFLLSATIFVGLYILSIVVLPIERTDKINDAGKEAVRAVSQEQLDLQYENEAREIFSTMYDISDNGSKNDAGQAKNLKTRLLELKVSKNFKDLHIKLVLAADGIEDYMDNGNQNKIDTSRWLVKQISKEYPWLVN